MGVAQSPHGDAANRAGGLLGRAPGCGSEISLEEPIAYGGGGDEAARVAEQERAPEYRIHAEASSGRKRLL